MHFVFQKKTKHQAMPVYGTNDDYLHVYDKRYQKSKSHRPIKTKVLFCGINPHTNDSQGLR